MSSKGLNTKVHRAIDKKGKPVHIIVSAGREADCAYAPLLMAGLPVKVLIADREYDMNHAVDTARSRGIEVVVIPSKRSRTEQRYYDKELYKERHVIEHVFRWITQWRGSATCYAKRSDSFLAALSVRCISFAC
ncbi:MAG: transposase [Treponema sp.]|nr:transposase [Treponema sp.]